MNQQGNRILRALNIKKSIVLKICLGAVVPLLIVSIAFSFVLYTTSMGIINQHLIPSFEQVLKTNMDTFHAGLDASLINGAKTSKDQYKRLKELVEVVAKHDKVQLVYIMSKVNGKDVILVLSGTDDYLTEYPYTPEQEKTLSTPDQTIFSEIYKDDYGVHKSVYYAIPGTDSMLGIDMDAKFIFDLQHKVLLISTVLTIVFAVLGAAVTYWVSSRLSKPILRLLEHTRVVAQGDLSRTVAVNRQDEIGQLVANFNTMTSQLRQMIEQVRETTRYVEASSDEVSTRTNHSTEMIYDVVTAIQEIASGNEAMSRVTTESSRAMQEMTTGMQHINESIFDVSEESVITAQEAGQGETIIAKAVKQMAAIAGSVAHSTELVRHMNERSREINGVVDMIKDIAGQINLLSLNAAIEAARAGEHGKGFAVVSSEIRKLADQTSTFSDEIFTTIHSIQEDTVRSADAMGVVTDEVKAGIYTVNAAGESFKRIKDLTVKVSDKFQGVSSVTEELSAAMQQVSANVENVSGITQKAEGNSKKVAASSQEQLATLEETAQSADELRDKAARLNELVSQFKL